jgi:hypothetical protein
MAHPPLFYYEPSTPVTTEFRVGLCAWQDKSMLDEGHFYPIKSMKAEERLWWYSRFFDCVEVNSTFYRAALGRQCGAVGEADAGWVSLQRQGGRPPDWPSP